MSKLNQKEFMQKSALIHGDRYDYSQVVYVNTRTKIDINCHIHGIFSMKPNNHLSGQGCPNCSGRKKLDTHSFISKAQLIHGDRYDYSQAAYVNNKTKINIICGLHGSFKQTPNDHLSGKGCIKCGGKKILSTDDFLLKAIAIHGNRYDYSLVNYINSHHKISIICRYHGAFYQTPTAHLSGNNCPKCSYNCISKMETKWLDSLSIPQAQRSVSINICGKVYRVDAYNPETNTIYEFYGDFWHGNPTVYSPNDVNIRSKKSFGKLYVQTMNREEFFRKNNFNIVHVWEYDFKRCKV